MEAEGRLDLWRTLYCRPDLNVESGDPPFATADNTQFTGFGRYASSATKLLRSFVNFGNVSRKRPPHPGRARIACRGRTGHPPWPAWKGECLVEDPVLQKANELRQEADELIQRQGLGRILSSFGTVWYTGSYRLGTMAWPDLDIHMVMEPDPWSVDAFFQLGARIAAFDGVLSMKFDDCAHHLRDGLPEGLYWGTRMVTEKREIPWKIDLWSTRSEVLEKLKLEMKRVMDRMTETRRRRILQIKNSLLTPEGRTPDSSGRHIYNAVLFEGLETLEEVKDYLRAKGIRQV